MWSFVSSVGVPLPDWIVGRRWRVRPGSSPRGSPRLGLKALCLWHRGCDVLKPPLGEEGSVRWSRTLRLQVTPIAPLGHNRQRRRRRGHQILNLPQNLTLRTRRRSGLIGYQVGQATHTHLLKLC